MEELKKLKENLELKSEKDVYVQEIVEKYGDFEAFVGELTKDLPENMMKFTPEEGFSQYLVEQKLENETNIYNYIHDSQSALIEQMRYLWSTLKIPEKMISESNFSTIQNKLLESLKELKDIHSIDIFSHLKANLPLNSPISKAIQMILYDYTGNGYINMNKEMTTKNPLILSKMAYFMNLVALNNQKVMIGEKFDSKGTIKVYRNIFLKRDLLKLYKENQLIFFTHLTSTSKNHIFKHTSDSTHINVEFEIKLLEHKNRRSWDFIQESMSIIYQLVMEKKKFY